MSFNCAHLVTLSVASACLLLKHKWLTYLISGALEIDKLIFFRLLRHLLAGMNGLTFFWARPLKMTFFRPLYCVLDAFLKKRMALPILKSYVRCWRKGRNINIKVNVIELYVIKSWWKIKFNKRKVYHQLVCLFVSLLLLIKQVLANLDKLDYVVTELLQRKK